MTDETQSKLEREQLIRQAAPMVPAALRTLADIAEQNPGASMLVVAFLADSVGRIFERPKRKSLAVHRLELKLAAAERRRAKVTNIADARARRARPSGV